MHVMEPEFDAARMQAWAEGIEAGTSSSLCFGERIATSISGLQRGAAPR
jgi:hypothetical protein